MVTYLPHTHHSSHILYHQIGDNDGVCYRVMWYNAPFKQGNTSEWKPKKVVAFETVEDFWWLVHHLTNQPLYHLVTMILNYMTTGGALELVM
jgi:hypothetical protein